MTNPVGNVSDPTRHPNTGEIPTTFSEVLQHELKCVQASRRLRAVSEEARKDNLIGLAFSGGGLRSATFNLGILQGLAQKGLLQDFDYLSAVSGGGYIASWFAALTRRFTEKHPDASFRDVERLLGSDTSALRWLRHYSTFLTSRTGPVSSETWARIATWLRNVFLNHVVVILGLLGLASALQSVLLSLISAGKDEYGLRLVGLGGGALFVACLSLAVSVVQESPPLTVRRTLLHRIKVPATVTMPFACTCVLLNQGLWARTDLGDADIFFWAASGAAFYLLVWGIVAIMAVFRRQIRRYRSQPWNPTISIPTLVLFSPVVGASGGCLLMAYVLLLRNLPFWTGVDWIVTVFGSSVIMVILLIVFALHLAMLGRGLGVQARDGIARIWGELLLVSMIWTFSAALVAFGPLLSRWLVYNHLAPRTVLFWFAFSMLGVLVARSGRSGEKLGTPPLFTRIARFAEGVNGDIESIKEADLKQMVAFLIKLPLKLLAVFTSRELMGVVATLAPYVYAVGGLLLISTFTHIAFSLYFDFVDTAKLWYLDNGFEWPALQDRYWTVLNYGASRYLIEIGALLFATLALSRRFGSSDFSKNYFFQSRLVRYYLGASNPNRTPQGSTGLDPGDDLFLTQFSKDYAGPYPILNAALNAGTGRGLGYTTGLARSFVFTPLYCGYDLALSDPLDSAVHYLPAFSGTGFAGSAASIGIFGSEGGISLGAAMVASGAGATRYTGNYPVYATAVFMRLFDVRLGGWIGNPRYPANWRSATPGWGLLSGLTATSNLEGGYVYLSDGGHFESLGVYELVKRRCRLIVACDAELDSEYSFEDLATLVERVRADFGARIEIDFSQTAPATGERQSERNFAIGKVFYDPNNLADFSTLVYIKIGMPKSPASTELPNGLPHDVWHYFQWHKAFPHEATAGQWFGEQQFEAYRALGEYIAGQAANNIGKCIADALG